MCCNIGTDSDPMFIKLLKALSDEQRKRYVDIFKKFLDVFSWTYEDIQKYDIDIIQHKIPLKPNPNSFRKKKRHVNPILLLITEKEIKKLMQKSLSR